MVRPKHNLPPESQKWARTVEEELQQAQFDANTSTQGNKNAFKALNSTMKQVSEQLVFLTTQQATLTAQQETLTTQVAAIAALVGEQVTGITGTATAGSPASPVSIPTTAADFAAVTFTVPVGYTRAIVLGVTTIVPSADVLIYTAISGSAGALTRVFGPGGNGGSSHTYTLTGLTGGTFSVRSTCTAIGSGTVAVVTTSASVMFLR